VAVVLFVVLLVPVPVAAAAGEAVPVAAPVAAGTLYALAQVAIEAVVAPLGLHEVLQADICAEVAAAVPTLRASQGARAAAVSTINF